MMNEAALQATGCRLQTKKVCVAGGLRHASSVESRLEEAVQTPMA
ncbi:MAG TPA: hypothetical protein VM223_24595 [Planctomycetota bacterium]|nr:hypothetical protein [Planctomycetota bacterium]